MKILILALLTLTLLASCTIKPPATDEAPNSSPLTQPSANEVSVTPTPKSVPNTTTFVWQSQILIDTVAPVNAAALYGNALFYITDNKLYKSGMDGNNSVQLDWYESHTVHGAGYMTVDTDGEFWIGNGFGNIAVFSQDGTLLREIDFQQKIADVDGMNGLFILPDGAVGAIVSRRGIGYCVYNIVGTEFEKVDDYVYSDDTDLFNWLDIGLDPDSSRFIGELADGTVIAIGNDRLCAVRKTAAASVAEKTEIVLAAGSWINPDLSRAIADFNMSDAEYKIRVVQYEETAKLLTEITAGNIPDLLTIDELNFDAFAQRGIFADLNPFLERDDNLTLQPDIHSALETEGKLFRLTPFFGVMTMYGNNDYIGNTSGWTLDELNGYLAAAPSGTKAFPAAWTKEEAMLFLVYQSLAEYVDWSMGTSSFNSDEFKQMLEFVKTFPDYPGAYTDETNLLMNGEQLSVHNTFMSFEEFAIVSQNLNGKLVCKGLPSATKSAGVLYPTTYSIAMSASAKDAEGVWRFLRHTLSYEPEIGAGFSINNDLFERQRQSAMVKSDTNATSLTQTQSKQFDDMLANAPSLYSSDTTIAMIIGEEIAPYFAGQKSVDNVCKIIQSRVELYLGEQH
jgi:ABC-type glycerol-3-phosphate transport system substrate-binding protein